MCVTTLEPSQSESASLLERVQWSIYLAAHALAMLSIRANQSIPLWLPMVDRGHTHTCAQLVTPATTTTMMIDLVGLCMHSFTITLPRNPLPHTLSGLSPPRALSSIWGHHHASIHLSLECVHRSWGVHVESSHESVRAHTHTVLVMYDGTPTNGNDRMFAR